jgi:hypothetical protein
MSLKIIDEVLLTDPKGKPITGIPQWQANDRTWADEKSINIQGIPIGADLMGMDPESITIDSEGNFWMGEEYRPSLLKFNSSGRLLKRFIPQNSLAENLIKEINSKYGSDIIIANLPEDYKYRKVNRGFEGLTFLNNKIYGILQSPLEFPNANHEKLIRILEFDVKKEIVINEFYYPLSSTDIDKIGDLTVNPVTSEFFAIQQNSKVGEKGQHLITSFVLNPHLKIGEPELKTFDFLKSKNALLAIENQLDLSKIGYDFAEKVEGLALLPDNQIAVINDNDFGVGGNAFDTITKRIVVKKDAKTVLGVINLK